MSSHETSDRFGGTLRRFNIGQNAKVGREGGRKKLEQGSGERKGLRVKVQSASRVRTSRSDWRM
jgi:hypothetical protein